LGIRVGSRRAKMTPKNIRKLKIAFFLLSKQQKFFASYYKFFEVFMRQITIFGHEKPGFGTGSGSAMKPMRIYNTVYHK
jgi:hypothetical protein